MDARGVLQGGNSNGGQCVKTIEAHQHDLDGRGTTQLSNLCCPGVERGSEYAAQPRYDC